MAHIQFFVKNTSLSSCGFLVDDFATEVRKADCQLLAFLKGYSYSKAPLVRIGIQLKVFRYAYQFLHARSYIGNAA